jgi:hypothetical protein
MSHPFIEESGNDIQLFRRITGVYIDPSVPLTVFQSTLEMNHNNHKPTQLKDSGMGREET